MRWSLSQMADLLGWIKPGRRDEGRALPNVAPACRSCSVFGSAQTRDHLFSGHFSVECF
ncbi:hypothetical protein ACRRTK_003531 [Alexandromys fortis]